MARRVHWIVPGRLDQRTGGYIYDRRIIDGLRARGWAVEVHELAGQFPRPDQVAAQAASSVIDWIRGEHVVIDGLALLAFADQMERLAGRWVGLIHHPLSMETGLPADAMARLAALEGPLMQRASHLIVTSPGTRRDLASFDIDPAKVSVVVPGVEQAKRARGTAGHRPRELLTVGSLTRRKGHLTLLAALAMLMDQDWHLNLVGSAAWDPEHAAEIDQAIADLGLGERVSQLGEQNESGLSRLYDEASLFVLASHHEGYGMVLSEALARALPIVSTTAGAIPETVPKGAGLLVPPGDPDALAKAIRTLFDNPERYRRLADGAADARARLQSWEESAEQFATFLDRAIG